MTNLLISVISRTGNSFGSLSVLCQANNQKPKILNFNQTIICRAQHMVYIGTILLTVLFCVFSYAGWWVRCLSGSSTSEDWNDPSASLPSVATTNTVIRIWKYFENVVRIFLRNIVIDIVGNIMRNSVRNIVMDIVRNIVRRLKWPFSKFVKCCNTCEDAGNIAFNVRRARSFLCHYYFSKTLTESLWNCLFHKFLHFYSATTAVLETWQVSRHPWINWMNMIKSG